MSRAGWGPLAVAAACLVAVVWAEQREPAADVQPASTGPSDEAVALLGGLQPADKIAGWTVHAISMPGPRQVRVELAYDEVRFAVTIAPLGELPESPALQTRRHAIYYGHARPEGTRLPRGGLRAILQSLRRRVEAHERDVSL